MSFTIPAEVAFKCPECNGSFKLPARQLSDLWRLNCPVCAHSFYWLEGVEPLLRNELIQEITESIRDVVKSIEGDVRAEERQVDEAVLRLLLKRIVER